MDEWLSRATIMNWLIKIFQKKTQIVIKVFQKMTKIFHFNSITKKLLLFYLVIKIFKQQ